jgi:hypothetical protein
LKLSHQQQKVDHLTNKYQHRDTMLLPYSLLPFDPKYNRCDSDKVISFVFSLQIT